jgi:hypothetical protein
VNDWSLRFWKARDAVEVIGRVDQADNPFAISAEPEVRKRSTKALIRRAVEAAVVALTAGDKAALSGSISLIVDDDSQDIVPDVNPDSWTVLLAALADLKCGVLNVHPDELVEALRDVEQQTLPLSRRK